MLTHKTSVVVIFIVNAFFKQRTDKVVDWGMTAYFLV